MTYEKGLFAQADPGIVSGSTIERKKMSTKTIYKRIALVAVTALGIGVLTSVSPANAAAQTGGALTAINAKAATANTGATNVAQVFYVGGTIANNAAMANTEDQRIRAVATSYPAGGFIGVTGSTGAASLTFTGAAVTDTGDGNSVRVLATADTTGGLTVTATGTDGLAAFSFTPTVAGSYSITIWNDIDDAGDIDIAEAITTLSFTVVGQAKLSAGLSTVHLTSVTGAAADATTSTVPVRAARALGTAAVASLTVTLRDTLGAVLTTIDGYTLTATVTGDAGGVGSVNGIVEAATPTFAGQCPGTQPVRLVQGAAAYNAVSNVYFCSSNQSGSSTITITATDADGVITTIGSRTISYYGSVATLEVTPILSVVRSAGGTTGDTTATRIATTAPAAYKVVAKDSAGQLVGGIAAGLSATPTTTIGSVTCAEDIFDTGTAGAYGLGGTGNYGCSVTSTALAASGGTGAVTIRVVDPADAAKYIVGTTANVTFGGAPSTVTMTFDKTSYAAGSAGTLTVNVKDSAGNNASDGVYATLLSGASTGNVTGSLPGAAVVVIGGKATSSVFMPNGAGTASVSNTLGATIASKAGTAVSATATVTESAGISALTTLVNSLIAKINALNKLVIKIQKKVRA
jgi:trimeric autotransporter adhesin